MRIRIFLPGPNSTLKYHQNQDKASIRSRIWIGTGTGTDPNTGIGTCKNFYLNREHHNFVNIKKISLILKIAQYCGADEGKLFWRAGAVINNFRLRLPYYSSTGNGTLWPVGDHIWFQHRRAWMMWAAVAGGMADSRSSLNYINILV